MRRFSCIWHCCLSFAISTSLAACYAAQANNSGANNSGANNLEADDASGSTAASQSTAAVDLDNSDSAGEAGADKFPELFNTEPETAGLLTPQQALEQLQLPKGFAATLFSAEPDVQNPIAVSVDPGGRVWIAENYTYAEKSQRFDLSLNDRVLVLEDLDRDGVADKRTVFTDTVQMLTGITTGQGGVWLMCPPQLLFVPDADGDLVPDGPPQVKLDGFHVARENYHNFANGLSWGPDGWLYGRCGASSPGEMGLPGTSDDQRVPIRGGMWRYHPQRQVVEALTHGTTNPWGHDWNAEGELFFINTVNGHFWHAIPGAHFIRSHTLDANPQTYELLDMHADHWHFDTGQSWTESRDGAADDFGGGHAHIGMMIYQESQWPEQFHGKVMTVNMHGRRINMERLEREGAGYTARHEPDFLLSGDTWFRGMEMVPCPDGNVLLIDWSDTGECHDHTGVHRTSGRIFKITYSPEKSSSGKGHGDAGTLKGGGKPAIDLPALPPTDLAKLQISGTEWESRRARELLRQQVLTGKIPNSTMAVLQNGLQSGSRTARLRCLWTLFQLEQIETQNLINLLKDPDEAIRSWAVRLLSDAWGIDHSNGQQSPVRPNIQRSSDLVSGTALAAGDFSSTKESAKEAAASDAPRTSAGNLPGKQIVRPLQPAVVEALLAAAKHETSAMVRLTLASTLQRLPLENRAELAMGLMSHPEDADDHNIPLMVWYGLTPLGDERLGDLVELAVAPGWPSTKKHLARRIVDQIESHPEHTERFLQLATTRLDVQAREQIIRGMSLALAGRRKVEQPAAWQDFVASAQLDGVAEEIQQLSVLFGSGRAMEELTQLATDGNQPMEVRVSALRSLGSSSDAAIQALRIKLLSERYLNSVAAEGLASSTDPIIGEQLIKHFRRFADLDRPRVISILASRDAWATSLLQAVKAGGIDRFEISAYQARQMSNLNDRVVDRLLRENWGQVRESPAERRVLIAQLKKDLSAERLQTADPLAGRRLFEKNCASCHILYGLGGKLGPDLTGAQRGNMDYLLENIVDPSAVVTKEFRATIVRLDNGRVLTGLATAKTDRTLSLATQNEVFQIPTDEIEQMKQSDASTMPDGLLGQLSPDEIRDLFAYLQSTQQVDEVE